MGHTITCDVCGKQVDEVLAKVYLSPVSKEKGANRRTMNQYTAYAFVGQCCLVKMHNFATWQKRKPKKHNEGRKLRRDRPTPAVAKSNGTAKGVEAGEEERGSSGGKPSASVREAVE